MPRTRRSARLGKELKPPSPAPVVGERIASTSDMSLASLPETGERQNTPDVVVPKSLQTSLVATPKKSMFSFGNLTGITQRTPRNKTPIKPSEKEMHPQLHHQTTTKPLEEARWLGFLSKGAHTEPSKGVNKLIYTQATPTKIPTTAQKSVLSTPEFKFRVTRPSFELSPEARQLMEETREEAAMIKAQMMAAKHAGASIADINGVGGRKYAQAKGKAGRFSDVHMEQFKRMDSIANHPSSFRADPNRFKQAEVRKSLKRSPSKAQLDDEDAPPAVRPSPSMSRLPAHASSGARPRSTVKLVSETVEDIPAVIFSNKRNKHSAEQDVSSMRPADKSATPKTMIPKLPASISRLPSVCTPTRSSLARAQSVRVAKTPQSNIPSLLRTPSTRTPLRRNISPSRAKSTIREGVQQISDSLRQKGGVRGILRSPQRHFSNDPLKIAAGTHVATPDRVKYGSNIDKSLPAVPFTAPVSKTRRVEFTASTVARAERDAPKTPTPVANTDDVEPPIEYPSLEIDYPSLTASTSSPSPAPSRRRKTLNELSIPGSFTFRSERQVSFGPVTSGIKSIRKTQGSNVCEGVQNIGKKRKLDDVEESLESDKENKPSAENEDDIEEGRNRKRARKSVDQTSTAPSKIPSSPADKSLRQGIFTLASSHFLNVISDIFGRRLKNTTPYQPATSFKDELVGRKWDLLLHYTDKQYIVDRLRGFSSRLVDDDSLVYSTAGFILFVAAVLLLFFGRQRSRLPALQSPPSFTTCPEAKKQKNKEMSSWSSRFGQMAGKFSPFGRNANSGNNQVTDSDFSYITSEDLARHAISNNQSQHAASPGANDDTIILRNKKLSYPIHFPSGSLSSGEITIGVLRIAAAQKLEIRDARRIKLLYKGKNLKDDKALARDEGLHSDHASEVLVTVSEASDSYLDTRDATDDRSVLSASSDDESADDSATPSNTASKKRKTRSKRKKRGGASGRKSPTSSSTQASARYTNNTPRPAEYLPIPSTANLRPSSAPPISAPQPSLSNPPMTQLDALESHFRITLQPQCEEFLRSTPGEGVEMAKWTMKQKGLAETILVQVMLKLDAVETDGNHDVRMRRKELVREVQGWLDRLDQYAGTSK
ncbi:hypothetical protein EJ05DRAFT_515418 [Pseudovirgaria hyperparasitica]|uniref:BAG domain-containing protein n=1 Tax=Pseudovirgaria hyperparasitica TaxID=470096 RepID=A0A6A6VSJ9_9PEZI|nr:uncharacterized protein EJ05DRAFT_515418 [Pseudovirgaria hyperparasitica]KAF2752756.1 hypothetical protein EJ05DRAFT_515418 [Pseudovirgaria hyperparasitica]